MKDALMTYIFFVIATGSLLFASAGFAAPAKSSLPPNWDAGGKAKTKMLPRRSMETGTSSLEAPPPVQDTPEIKRRWSVSLNAGSPDLLRLDLRYQFFDALHVGGSVSPGWPFDITVEMPSDVIKADKTNTLAVAYTAFDASFKATWGPQLSAYSLWHPFYGSWFLVGGIGYRQLGLSGSASSQLRVCTVAEAAKEPPCANDQTAIQTRNRLEVEAKVTMDSTMILGGTGWLWKPGDRWEILLSLGVTRALKTKTKISVNASIVDPDGTPQEVSGALADLKAKSERDVADKAEKELGTFATMNLPLALLGVGYRF